MITIAADKRLLIYTVKNEKSVSQLAWSPGGEYLAVLSDHKVHILNPYTGQTILDINASGVEYFSWSPDGKSLGMLAISYSNGHEVQIWDISTSRKKQTIGSGKVGLIFAWSPDGERIASPWGSE